MDWTVQHVSETGSTNTDLLGAVEVGSVGDRTALLADHQTAGRGRLDRRWDAPPGVNLLVSLLFASPPSSPSILTQRVGLAAIGAIEGLVGADLRERLGLKWPNDVLLDGRKLAGVLAQRSAATGAVVVGIGVNVGWAPEAGSSLARNLGLLATPRAVLDPMLLEVDRLDEEATIVAYRSRLLTLGQRVRVELPGDRVLLGIATGVDGDGRLCVDDGADTHILDVGDVVHLRPNPD
jgi:BirA family biotin operon repressor/biotin-[acetyl-CoA-carboxylase] ligase